MSMTSVSGSLERGRQPLMFLLVGAGGLAVNMGLFELQLLLGLPYVAAAVVSYLISNALMYVGNRYLTFRLGHEGFWSAYLRYVIVGLVVVALNATILALLVEFAGLDETIAQALSLLAVTPVAFILFKRWTFRL